MEKDSALSLIHLSSFWSADAVPVPLQTTGGAGSFSAPCQGRSIPYSVPAIKKAPGVSCLYTVAL
jgi:hypothetical protein